MACIWSRRSGTGSRRRWRPLRARACSRRLESPAPPVLTPPVLAQRVFAPPVIARSAATKQPPAPGAGACFVASLLAMTGGVTGQRENALTRHSCNRRDQCLDLVTLLDHVTPGESARHTTRHVVAQHLFLDLT